MTKTNLITAVTLWMSIPAAFASPGNVRQGAVEKFSNTSSEAVWNFSRSVGRGHLTIKKGSSVSPDHKLEIAERLSSNDHSCPCRSATHVHNIVPLPDTPYLNDFPLFGGDNLLCRYPTEGLSDTLPADRFEYSVVFRKGAPLH